MSDIPKNAFQKVSGWMEICDHQWRHIILFKQSAQDKFMAGRGSDIGREDFDMEMDKRRCAICNRHEKMVDGKYVEDHNPMFRA